MSSDGGANWTLLEGWMTYGGAMAVSPASEDVVFTAGTLSDQKLAIDYTLDAGSTWNHVIIDDGCWGRAIAFDPFDVSRVFVAGIASDSSPRLLVSDDLGQNWTQQQTGLTAAAVSIQPDPVTSGLMYCATTDGVFKTTDGAQTWQSTALTDSARALLINPEDGRIYAGTSTGVYYSEDGGDYWEEFNFGLTTPSVLSLALAGGANPTLYAGTCGGGVFITTPMTGIVDNDASPLRHGVTVTSPCRDFATLHLGPGTLGSAVPVVRLFDLSGRLVLQSAARNLKSEMVLDLRGLSSGTYILRLTTANWSASQPLVVMH
jgi:photosystem II stability/assembly factor-like uncharacterized protein